MFTGIVEELGRVADVEDVGDASRLTIEATTVLDGTGLGESIAVDGCCLTVAARTASTWTADVMAETASRTTLGRLEVGDPVNLERALTLQQRLGGHLVQGHVDGVGSVRARHTSEHWDVVEIGLPADAELGRYVVEKGSIAVDGVSLTVVSAEPDRLTVSLIPETLARTTLGLRAAGDPVNLEVDVLAKHVERLLAWQGTAPERAS